MAASCFEIAETEALADKNEIAVKALTSAGAGILITIAIDAFLITTPVAAVIIPLLLIQYYIHKKILDPTYYNTDHFSAGELVVLTTGFIFYIHKALIYVRAIALPKTMRIRFKENILTFKNTLLFICWLILP